MSLTYNAKELCEVISVGEGDNFEQDLELSGVFAYRHSISNVLMQKRFSIASGFCKKSNWIRRMMAPNIIWIIVFPNIRAYVLPVYQSLNKLNHILYFELCLSDHGGCVHSIILLEWVFAWFCVCLCGRYVCANPRGPSCIHPQQSVSCKIFDPPQHTYWICYGSWISWWC